MKCPNCNEELLSTSTHLFCTNCDFKCDRDSNVINLFELPTVKNSMTQRDTLDYIALVIARYLVGDVAFKGGYMLNKLLSTSRRTYDVDISVMRKGDYETVKKVLKEIAEKFIVSGFISSYKIKEEISSRSSGGIDMYAEDGSKVLGVDVGLHDISYGVKHYQLSFASVNAFEIERMMSDKIVAILSRNRFRRAKDLYDVFAISNTFDLDFNKLLEYIERRGGAEWENIPFSEEILILYRRAWDKLVLRAPTDNSILDKPSFEEVLDLFMRIASPLKLKKEHIIMWSSKERGWVYDGQ